jgi:hypothetical protein
MIVLQGLSEGTYREMGEEIRMSESEKYWNIASVYDDHTMQCIISYWIIGE